MEPNSAIKPDMFEPVVYYNANRSNSNASSTEFSQDE